MPRDVPPPESCPVCGEPVPRGAKACPHCGADERTGWDADSVLYDGLDLPDEAFADEEPPPPRRPASGRILWIVVAVVLLAFLVRALIFR